MSILDGVKKRQLKLQNASPFGGISTRSLIIAAYSYQSLESGWLIYLLIFIILGAALLKRCKIASGTASVKYIFIYTHILKL